MRILIRYSFSGGAAPQSRTFDGPYTYSIIDGTFAVVDKETYAQYLFSLHLCPIIEIFPDEQEQEQILNTIHHESTPPPASEGGFI
jgi:hypothetical protein